MNLGVYVAYTMEDRTVYEFEMSCLWLWSESQIAKV